jgi:hypothetical protein
MATASTYTTSATTSSPRSSGFASAPWQWSDDEEDPEVTWETASKWELPFGKYRGEALGMMVRTARERGYLRYLLGWDKLREDTEAKIQCVLAHYGDLAPVRKARKTKSPKTKKDA